MEILFERKSDLQSRRKQDLKKEKLIVFLLESDDNAAKFISSSLKKIQSKILLHRAVTENEFVDSLNKFNPEVIIAGNQDPDFNSTKVIRYLRNQEDQIPVIIISEKDSAEDAVRSLKEGAFDYFFINNISSLPHSVSEAAKQYRESNQKKSDNIEQQKYQQIYTDILNTLNETKTGFIIVEAGTKNFRFVNEAFCKICKYEVREIFELSSLVNLLNGNDKDSFEINYTNTLRNKNGSTVFNSILVRKDDKKINVEFTARNTTINNEEFITMIVRDVTDTVSKNIMKKLTEEALQESEKRYRSLIENVKDYAIFILDFGGKIISWNIGAERILSYKEKEIILKNFNVLVSNHFTEEQSASLINKAKEEGYVESELQLTGKDGRKLWASITITKLNHQGNDTGTFSVIIHDLTKNKVSEEKLQEQEVQLRSLAKHLQDAREEERLRIARELHDEFSQMLTVLRMDLTVLGHSISKNVSEPFKRITLLEKISSISELLETTIRSTRRIITELRPAVLDELGLFTAIQWQAQEFENRTGIRCKIIKLQHDINLEKNTSTAIFRILQEGLTNVAKHSGAKNVIISLKVINEMLLLEIEDNGKGIDENKIKEPTSTGLIGIRERIMALNGNFEIRSEKDKGTQLLISVPYISDKNNFNGE